MSKTHLPYVPAYRRQMVELAFAGRTAGELTREFECSAQRIRKWVRQAERDEGRREDGLRSKNGFLGAATVSLCYVNPELNLMHYRTRGLAGPRDPSPVQSTHPAIPARLRRCFC